MDLSVETGTAFTEYLILFLQLALLYVFGTVIFDVVHYILHKFINSKHPWLQKIGGLHQAHHDFLDEELKFHKDAEWANIVYHLIPEYVTHSVFTLVGLWWFHPYAVLAVIGVHTINFIGAVWMKGRDFNHVELDKVPAPKPNPFVGPRYHSLHHIYPNQYMGSLLKLFDTVAGTGCQLAGKRILITGGTGSFGAGMVELLKTKNIASIKLMRFGSDWNYDQYDQIEAQFDSTDILILAHGAKVQNAMDANCHSFVELIERFRNKVSGRRFPCEVWAVGSEIESHSHWGNKDLKIYKASKNAFARYARYYYWDDSLIYRHIVPAAFTSPMGPGLISGKTAARIALFFIRRGFQYVPVTYTGIAFANYLKFLFRVNVQTPDRHSAPLTASN